VATLTEAQPPLFADPRERPFTARQLLEMDACTRCGECLRACDSFRVKGDEGVSLMGMIRRRRHLFREDGSLLRRLFRRDGTSDDAWSRYQEGVFDCTLCGRCEIYCPVGIKTRDLAIAMRQELATARCMLPKNLDRARDAVFEEGNIFGYPNEERALWAEFLDDLPADLLSKERADVLYFVGCVSSFSPAVQEIPQAFLRLLLKAGVDVGLLAGKEWCCGFPLIVGGLAKDAEQVIARNIEGIHRLGAKTVVFNCPSCYYTWRRYYPLEGVRLMHSAEFIAELVRSGRLTFRAPESVFTYHDPCDLGRGLGVYDPPRQVLRALAGDDAYVELTPSRERALCCGGGGDVEIWDPELTGEINGMLTGAVEKSGAQVVVQGCPQCKRITQRGLSAKGSGVRSMDIAEAALAYGVFTDDADDRQADPT
jgi:heterodisulfide reductase subunit D